MLNAGIQTLNYLAGVILSDLVNSAIPGVVAIGLTSLLAWRRGWNAASRYCGWWLLSGLLLVLPFVPKVERGQAPVAKPAPAASRLATPGAGYIPERIVTNPDASRVWPSPVAVFLLCWAAAACLQLARVVRGITCGLQWKRRSREAPAHIQVLFEALRGRVKARRRVMLRLSDQIESPAVLGYLRPQILLPDALLGHLRGPELEQVLLHELAHVERWDDWTIALQRTLEAIGIFHPLVAYLARQMNLDREMASDDRVAALCEPRGYAACLTRVAEIRSFGSAAPVTVPLLLERKPELLARVESLLDGTRGHTPGVSVARLVGVFGCAASVAIAGAFAPRLLALPTGPEMTLITLPALPAAEVQGQTLPERGPASPAQTGPSISGIEITSRDGSSSSFGSRSGDGKREPGTITFDSSGKRYVIRDSSTIDEARKILEPMQELGRKQAALGEQQSKLGEQQAQLGAKQEALVAAPLGTAAMKGLEEQLRNLEKQLHQIDVQKELKTAEEAMQKLGDLQGKLGEMQERMAAAQGLLGEKQGNLGEEQGKLGEQQGHLGELQGKLGEQQAREAQKAKRQLEDLIRRAQQRGLAQPLP